MTPRSAEHGTHHLDAVYDAVLFDMDGVVTNTAAIHAAAWKQLFDEVLRDPRVQVDDPETTFDPAADYRRYVDGRTREDGVSAYLTTRGIALDAGDPDDPPTAWTIAGLAARKNELFLAELGSAVRAFNAAEDPAQLGLQGQHFRIWRGGARAKLEQARRPVCFVLFV